MRMRKIAGLLWVVAGGVVFLQVSVSYSYYGRGPSQMSVEQLLKVTTVSDPGELAIEGKLPSLFFIRLEHPELPWVSLDWIQRLSPERSKFEGVWLFTSWQYGKEDEYCDLGWTDPEPGRGLIKELVPLIAKLPPIPFRDSGGYPERAEFDRSRFNIEVTLAYTVSRSYDYEDRLNLIPADAPRAPVYLASCDPRPENAKKEGSHYETCKAIGEIVKNKVLPLARKYFPQIPETRVVDRPRLRLQSCEREIFVGKDGSVKTLCDFDPPKKKKQK